jgi:hypothetical protein
MTMQTSTDVGVKARKVHSFPSLDVLPDWLQTFLGREAESHPRAASRSERLNMLQRDGLRYLMSRQHVSGLGDCLAFGVADRASIRGMSQVLRALQLDELRVLALDSDLTPALRQARWLRKASVVRIGSNLHASTAAVLQFVEPLIVDQSILLFEAWNEQDEAFEAFLRAHPSLTAQRLSTESTDAQSFVVTRALTV